VVPTFDLIAVPFDGYGRAGHQSQAAAVLREAGLVGALALHPVVEGDGLRLPPGDPSRGTDTSLVNEAALVTMVDLVGERVASAVADGRFPLVYGGDCTTLLGSVPALRHEGPLGLLFVDGHEDTMPLDVSEDGEAANTELGLLLGLTGHLMAGPLALRVGALSREEVAVLGPRDVAWRQQFNVGSLRDSGVWLRDWQEVAAQPEQQAEAAVAHVMQAADCWWLHVDLDVLDPVEFPAQGIPGVADDPLGLTWAQLTGLLTAAVAAGGCVGWSLAIYDPDQDPDRSSAASILALVSAVTSALPPGAPPQTRSTTRSTR
jgi:arginase